MNEQKNDGPTKIETLFGAINLQVTLLNGKEEVVIVRQIPIRLMPQYQSALNNEPRMVELLCDKPEGWSDTIAIRSFEQIVIEGERINADFFGRWRERQKARENLIPKADIEEISAMLEAVERASPGSLNAFLKGTAATPSPSPSPALPSDPESRLRKPAASP